MVLQFSVCARVFPAASGDIGNYPYAYRVHADEETGGKSPAWFDLRTAVLDTASAHSFRDVSIEPGEGEVELFADPLVGKVFYNLIDNAVAHGGYVTRCMVTASENKGGGLVIVFADDGCGIPGRNKELVFTQGFGTRTGLGLFLIRRILSITAITIRETGTEGKGARFEMVVPGGNTGSGRMVRDKRNFSGADKKQDYAGLISTSFSDRPFSQISEALPITSETIYFSPSATPSGRHSG